MLDIGAGSGTITASFAKYMPDGHVTATDISEDILRKAAEYSESAGVTNISFQTANVYELPFDDNSFDIAHTSQVLVHLEYPVRALKEMFRVVRPGGIVAVRESDLRMWSMWPEIPALDMFHKTVMLGRHQKQGGRVNAGAQLVSWAIEAGARRDQIDASCGTWTYSTPAERRVWGGTMLDRAINGNMGKAAVKEGALRESDLQDMADGWKQWIDAEDGWFGCLHGEILVRI